MADTIKWVLEVDIADGKMDELKTLMTDMSAATRADEPGTLDYEWLTDAEGGRCHILERFKDSGAAMAHLGNFGAKFAERFMAILTPTRLSVYGPATDELRGAVAGIGAVHYGEIGGFHR